ncbi:unnamed protein product [Rotaria sp. Silwood2]|nr:unnamed protein product [Rotaria sp. Silwood2]
MSQAQDWTGVRSRKIPIALGNFNNDHHLDIIVTQPDSNKMNIFFGLGDGTFPTNPQASVISSSPPYFIAVGDFNNDSWLDFAIANYDRHNIGIFLNYGNGTFKNESTYSTGSSRPLSLSIHDFNNDKYLDIVVANDGTNNVGVLLGYGNGSFSDPLIFSTGFDSLPNAVVVADVNSDNQPDIVVANSGTNTIGVFLGFNDGTFSHQITSLTSGRPVSLAVGDFNGDTRLDVVVANNDSNIQIFLGNGNGTFTSLAIYATGFHSYPSSVAVRDFNKDGRLDIIVVNSGTKNLGLFLGYGNGIFENQRVYPINNGAPQIVDAGDLNNDTWIDIVVSIYSPYNVGVFLGGPDKNFTNYMTYPTGGLSNPYAVAVADFNNDTKLDIVVTNSRSNEIAIFIGQGDGNFGSRIAYSTGTGSAPQSVAAGDFNSDNRLDIVVANSGTDNIGIFLGNIDEVFSDQITYQTGDGSQPLSVAVSDLNNDQQLDIIVANYGTHNLGIFLGYGNGTLSDQTIYSTEWKSSPSSVAVGDFNNDKWLDIVVTNYHANNIGIFLGYGNGTFSNQIVYSTGGSSGPYSVAVSDFNNDKRLDVVVGNYGADNLGIFFGYGDGNFSTQIVYSTGKGSGPNSVAVGDLNNDTQLDLIVANYNMGNVGILLGNRNGTFSSQTTYSTGWESLPNAVALADFNSDDRLDIVVTLVYFFSIGIFFGYYNSPFTVPIIYTSNSVSMPFALAVADFDNDNLLDLVATNYGDDNVDIYQNFVNGTFQSSKLYSTGYTTGLYSIAVGDFNNDNHVDVVVANYDSDNITIFLDFGNRSFESGLSYTTGLDSGPCSLAIGNFNNDSRPDIVDANNADNSIILFLFYGFGAFPNEKKVHTNTSYIPSRGVAFGDFDKDHRIDMVLADFKNDTITVLLGNDNGVFSSQTRYSTGRGSYPFSVATGDFNNDTRLDIVVANAHNDNVGIFLGKGDGTFFDQVTYSTEWKSEPTIVTVGDFNNDNRLDIVLTNYRDFSIGVLLGNGDGTFPTHTEYSTGDYSYPWGIAVGDFNNDAGLDVVTSNHDGYTISVFLGYGNGTFTEQTSYPTGEKSVPIGIDVGDFNNDNRMDIVVANYGNDNVGIFFGNGDGSFSNQVTYSTGNVSGPYWVAVGDFNQDAQLDVAVALSLSDNVAICFGDGNGTLSSPTTFGTGRTFYPWYLTVYDFNNDTWLDIAVVLGQVGGIMVLLGDKDTMFLVPIKYSTNPNSAPQTIVVGDFNNDKYLDVGVTYSKSNNVGFFFGNGDGRFSKQVTYSTGTDSRPWSMAVADFNNDTRLDVVVTNRNSNNIGVFLGLENGTFSEIITYSTGLLSDPISAVILDFDRDNKLDIAVANNGGNSISIFQGYGNGEFLNVATYSTGYNSHPVSIVIGDFNNDGWMDIVVATLGTKNLKILLKLC